LKIRKWDTIQSDRVYRTPIFDLHRRRSVHPGRGERDFFVLEAPAWVNIIPLTEGGEVVMVRQFRHGISGFTLEIPGGMVDPEDSDPMAAARREMREETGYDSAAIAELGWVHPNPAIQPNLCHSFLARDVHKVGEPRLDGTEETEVVRVPLTEVKELIASGAITHALVIAAFSFFHVYNPPRP
jgi:ADP-ribose diphosphatase